jgi:hypothetical protein
MTAGLRVWSLATAASLALTSFSAWLSFSAWRAAIDSGVGVGVVEAGGAQPLMPLPKLAAASVAEAAAAAALVTAVE